MLETHSGQSARQVHLALKSALQKMVEAEKCAVICFGEIMARRLYRELGYSSINHYAEAELGFSARRTRDFVTLSRRLADLPRLKKEVESGNLGYTAARVIAPIVDQDNEQGWVDFATTHSRRELEREVKTAKREAAETAKGQPTLLPVPRQAPAAVVPVRVSLEMTPTQFARYESLWEQIRKQGGVPADQVETLLAVMQSFTEAGGPRGPENQATQPAGKTQHHLNPTGHKAPCPGAGPAQMPTPRLRSHTLPGSPSQSPPVPGRNQRSREPDLSLQRLSQATTPKQPSRVLGEITASNLPLGFRGDGCPRGRHACLHEIREVH